MRNLTERKASEICSVRPVICTISGNFAAKSRCGRDQERGIPVRASEQTQIL